MYQVERETKARDMEGTRNHENEDEIAGLQVADLFHVDASMWYLLLNLLPPFFCLFPNSLDQVRRYLEDICPWEELWTGSLKRSLGRRELVR